MEDLIQAIRLSGVNLPGGHTQAGKRRFTVRTSGDFRSIEQINRTAVHSSPGNIIYVENIAQVGFGDALPTHEARYNDQKAVFISVVQREGSNIFEVMEGIKAELERFQNTLPEGVKTALAHDQTESVNERVTEFFNSLLQGLVLVGLMTLLLLGARSAIVITLAIPISVLIGLTWLDLAGYGLQQMSIAGLVIALGLLVDNAIVVTENVGRFLRQGYSPREAAAKGASQVGWAVASGTLTTVLAFVPILGLQTGAGTFLRSMPVTVILTLIASRKLSQVEPFVDQLRPQFAEIPGARITVKELLQGPPYEAPVSIRVVGDDLNQVLVASREVEKIMASTPEP